MGIAEIHELSGKFMLPACIAGQTHKLSKDFDNRILFDLAKTVDLNSAENQPLIVRYCQERNAGQHSDLHVLEFVKKCRVDLGL